MTKDVLVLRGLHGIGDCFFQRPVVYAACRRYKQVFLECAYPPAYWDLERDFDLKFLFPEHCNPDVWKGVLAFDRWSDVPRGLDYDTRHCTYMRTDLELGRTASEAMARRALMVMEPEDWNFRVPLNPAWGEPSREKVLYVFPSTIRDAWTNYSRVPMPEYLRTLRYEAMERGIETRLVVQRATKHETIVGTWEENLVETDAPLESLITMLYGGMVLCSPCFALPLSIAFGIPVFCVFGGSIPPAAILDKHMDLSGVGYAAPEPFCSCLQLQHACNKRIEKDRLVNPFLEWLSKVA